jgi:SAM-dependent methyltransferase
MVTVKNNLQQAHGYFDFVEFKNRQLAVHGWMLLPETACDTFLVFVNKKYTAEAPVLERDGVAQAFPFIPHAKHSGFQVSLQTDDASADGLIDICLTGVSKGEQAAKMEIWYSQEVADAMPIPPLPLMKRVANTENISFFRTSSFKSFRDYWELASNHSDTKKIRTMLDWGCGCGRLINAFIHLTRISEIHGCDIDHEAITWCKQNISRATFAVIPPVPPTGYPDNSFDLVVGNSVLTHLTKDLQLVWLKEVRRIVTPGGLFLTSLHGEFATSFAFQNSTHDVLKRGIDDEILDSNLDGIAPANYYRGTYQSQEYTKRVFSDYFKVLDYIERGSLNFQDIIVLKKS